MDFSPDGSSSPKSYYGIGLVVLIHVILVYALVTGLARKVVDVIQKPVETMIVSEIQPPPPPPPPPPKLAVQPVKVVTTPPPFVPPPEVKVQVAPVENVITAVTNVKPPVNEPPAPKPAVVESPPPETPKVAVRTSAKVTGNCEKPEYPTSSLKGGEEGAVIIRMTIGVDGSVIDSVVEKSSGFTRLDQATLKAWSLCRFTPAMADGQAVQSEKRMQYVWKLNSGN